MRRIRRHVQPTQWALLMGAVVLLTPITLATSVAPSAAATPNATGHENFAGYIALPLQGKKAQATIAVPTMTCGANSGLKILFFWQYLQVSEGNYAEAWVEADCTDGSATYDASASVCAFSGCGGCEPSSPIPVSAGDSVTLSEAAPKNGNDYPTEAEVTDTTSGVGLGCAEFGTFRNTFQPVYTGICGQDLDSSGPNVTSSKSPPPFDCQGGNRPKFSTVTFADVTIDGKSLGSFDPTGYNMRNGSTLQVSTSKITDDGDSFSGAFVHH